MERKEYIPLEECKHGFGYRIHSRNLSYGVFNEKTKGFVGVREKFGCEYLFTEYHYDTGAPFGTVTPKSLDEECPIEDLSESNKELFDWMKKKDKIFSNIENFEFSLDQVFQEKAVSFSDEERALLLRLWDEARLCEKRRGLRIVKNLDNPRDVEEAPEREDYVKALSE